MQELPQTIEQGRRQRQYSIVHGPRVPRGPPTPAIFKHRTNKGDNQSCAKAQVWFLILLYADTLLSENIYRKSLFREKTYTQEKARWQHFQVKRNSDNSYFGVSGRKKKKC